MRLMCASFESNVRSSAVTVTEHARPTDTFEMSYSSTRIETRRFEKSTIWIRLAPATTSSSSATLIWLTVPSKLAFSVSPLERRMSLSPSLTFCSSET